MIPRSRIEKIKHDIGYFHLEDSSISFNELDQVFDLALKSLDQEKLVVALNTCKNDYWFMSQLLERAAPEFIGDAVKDCIERMKFRVPMFTSAMESERK